MSLRCVECLLVQMQANNIKAEEVIMPYASGHADVIFLGMSYCMKHFTEAYRAAKRKTK